MKKNFFTTLVALGLVFHFWAPPVYASRADAALSDISRCEAEPNDGCDLEAPDNFRVTDLTPTSVSLAWDSVHNAAAYRVQVFEAGTTILITQAIVTTTSAQLTVPSGMLFDISVVAIGAGCPPSRNASWLLKIGVIIVDLIAEVTGSPGIEFDEVLPDGDGCYEAPLTADAYWFDVYRGIPSNANRYEIAINNADSMPGLNACPNDGDIRIWKAAASAVKINGLWTDPVGLSPANGWNNPPVCNTPLIRIREKVGSAFTDLYEVQISGANEGISVCFKPLMEDFKKYGIKFWKLSDAPDMIGSKANWALRNAGAPDSGPFVISPFQDNLHINLPPNADPGRPTTIRLFDLQGRLLRMETTAISGALRLPAADLVPGIYLLLVENGGDRRTFKVAKF